MNYYMSNFGKYFGEGKKDFGKNVFSGDGLTLQVYHLKKDTSLMERDDGTSIMNNDRHVIVYLVTRGLIEIRMDDERVKVSEGHSITLQMDNNFSVWALEDSDLFSVHNTVEPNVDNTPEDLVNAVREVELKDMYLDGHNYRVGKYSTLMMQAMDASRSTTNFHFAGAYHDVGKVVVPAEVLNKNGRLTPEEFDEIKKHPAASYEMLREYIGEKNACFARWHHEKLDGSGYPDGLKGDEIPLESRIMAVADIFDALTTSRVYRKAFSFEKALSILEEDVEKGKLDRSAFETLKRMIESGVIVEGEDNEIKGEIVS